MRVVLCPGNTFQLSCGDKLTHQNARASLYALTAIVGKLHLVLVELDAVTEDAEHGTGTHDVGVEAFFLQGVVLGKTCLIDKVHGFFRCVLDVLVIRGKREEKLVEHFHMALGFHIQRFLHRASIHEDRHCAVKDIDLLVGIIDHRPGCPDAGDTDDDAARKEEGADNQHQLDFVFEILYNHNEIDCSLTFAVSVFHPHVGDEFIADGLQEVLTFLWEVVVNKRGDFLHEIPYFPNAFTTLFIARM